jgi:hypothetical protein
MSIVSFVEFLHLTLSNLCANTSLDSPIFVPNGNFSQEISTEEHSQTFIPEAPISPAARPYMQRENTNSRQSTYPSPHGQINHAYVL